MTNQYWDYKGIFADFNGGTCVDCDKVHEFDMGSTIAFWVRYRKPAADDHAHTLPSDAVLLSMFYRESEFSPGLYLRISNMRCVTIRFADSMAPTYLRPPCDIETKIDVTDGDWHHLAFAFKAHDAVCELTAYKDGAKVHTERSYNAWIHAPYVALRLGKKNFALDSDSKGATEFVGSFAQVQIFKSLLGEKQLREVMFTSPSDVKENLILYWTLAEDPSIIYDFSMNGHVGTVLGEKLTWRRKKWICWQGFDFSGYTLRNAYLFRAELSEAVLTEADLAGAILEGTFFSHCNLTKANFSGTALESTSFSDCNLTQTIFADALLKGTAFKKCDLTRAVFDDEPEIGHSKDCQTKFEYSTVPFSIIKQNWSYLDLTGAKITGKPQDLSTEKNPLRAEYVNLSGVDLGHANLTKANLSGARLHGANLTHATLTGADLTGAQLGSMRLLFEIREEATVDAFKTALDNRHAGYIKTIFQENNIRLSENVTIDPSQYAPSRSWTVKEQKGYTVRLKATNGSNTLQVFDMVKPAALTNAFMKDAILTSANLCSVEASGVQLYGKAKLDGDVILEQAKFDNANMSGIDLKQAKLSGVNLAHTALVGAQFQGACLEPDVHGGLVSLANANLLGADFSDATLTDVNFTDAAVSVARSEDSRDSEGVWLFTMNSISSIVAELNAGAKKFRLDIELETNLKNGRVTEQLRKEFQNNGVLLAEDADVSISDYGPYWQVMDGATTYVIFQSVDDHLVPALGINEVPDTKKKPMGWIPLFLQEKLQNGPMDQAVIDAFKTNGIALSTNASVRSEDEATDWQITDSSASYRLWRGLDESCEWSIFVAPSMPDFLTIFSSHSTPLSRRVTVSIIEGKRWRVDNDSNNPYKRVTEYITFNVAQAQDQGGELLDVYGSKLRVMRLSAPDQVEYHNIACDVTKLTRTLLESSDKTLCPNGEFVSTNKNVPFQKWMRANKLPRPPPCVASSDGSYYCPPIAGDLDD